MSLFDKLVKNKSFVKIDTKKSRGANEKNCENVLALNPKGRLTIPKGVFNHKEVKGSKFFSSLYNKEDNRLAIIFFEKKPVSPRVKSVSFYKGSATHKTDESTAYVELKPELSKILESFFNKNFHLESSVYLPFSTNEGYLSIDLSILTAEQG